MSLWAYLGIACGGLVLACAVVVALALRQSSAGIVTSRFGRTTRLAWNAVRMYLRHLVRRVRRVFSSEARRVELDRQFHESSAKAALETMGNMKGALMKLGQIASFMDETLPETYREQLRQLQCQAPPMSYEVVARVVREELGDEPEELFLTFDKEPLASASIGQVHRATLPDGTEVVVKVQYPGVDRAIAADLDNAGMILGVIGMIMPNVDAAPIAEEMRARLSEELDYQKEAENQALFARLFEGHLQVVVPRVFPRFSSRRVLTSELVRGKGFYDFVATATPEQKRQAVRAVHTFVYRSMWTHHVFNGDPHPGNYLFLPDGRVAFLDFGCVKHFDPAFIESFLALNRSYLTGERDAYFDRAKAMGFVRPGYEHLVDRDWFWDYARWFYLPILEDEPFAMTGDYCKQSLSVIFGESMKRLSMPPEYVMMNRITFGLNSIFCRLDACENFRRLSLHYYFGEDEPPYSTPGARVSGAPS
ncbi:MAG: AarF/ABC1/UbiB kinase family protein [Myxococcales bacterium]|nr:AarF/ABC1/UbiB kinase family protein [Myxococcales bacterium]